MLVSTIIAVRMFSSLSWRMEYCCRDDVLR